MGISHATLALTDRSSKAISPASGHGTPTAILRLEVVESLRETWCTLCLAFRNTHGMHYYNVRFHAQVHTGIHASSDKSQILDIDQRLSRCKPGFARARASIGALYHDDTSFIPLRSGTLVLANVTSQI